MTRSLPHNLVLIGGGHSHAIVLRKWAKRTLRNVRLQLLSDVKQTPYSGMLPAHVAGLYSYQQTHIDLPHIAQFAQAEFQRDRAIGLDVERKQVLCRKQPPLPFDYLSIDIGSTPATIAVPGAKEYAVPAKPVPIFLQHWYQFLEQVATTPNQPRTLTIVGGGAGGVELAFNMQQRLQAISDCVTIHLFQRGTELLPQYGKWLRRYVYQLLVKRGINLHVAETVNEVLPNKIICESGLRLETDIVFWVTQPSAPDWIQKSGLATDDQGFILVNHYLQSVSHPFIFAAGDIATIQNDPRPKAGVFAVRQGQPLFENLQRMLLDKPLKPYYPQRHYLSLIGTGDKNAIAHWGGLGLHSRLLWRLKDRIDRKFMEQFTLN